MSDLPINPSLSLTDEVTDRMEAALRAILPPEPSRFGYEVIDGYELIIEFVVDTMPSPEQFHFLATEVADCLDSMLPIYGVIPTWTGGVHVGAKLVNHLPEGGQRVFTFWDSTENGKGGFCIWGRSPCPLLVPLESIA